MPHTMDWIQKDFRKCDSTAPSFSAGVKHETSTSAWSLFAKKIQGKTSGIALSYQVAPKKGRIRLFSDQRVVKSENEKRFLALSILWKIGVGPTSSIQRWRLIQHICR